jgi:hypothetical protein
MAIVLLQVIVFNLVFGTGSRSKYLPLLMFEASVV